MQRLARFLIICFMILSLTFSSIPAINPGIAKAKGKIGRSMGRSIRRGIGRSITRNVRRSVNSYTNRSLYDSSSNTSDNNDQFEESNFIRYALITLGVIAVGALLFKLTEAKDPRINRYEE